MTIQQMAQQALDVQNACNLSGVVTSFRNIVESMRLEHGMDTPTCNRHPVSVMFACKIADMTGAYGGVNITEADEKCKELARG